jgi:hypothetical protein
MTKPIANAAYPGAAVHTTNAAACSTPASTTAPRRDHRSASAPAGTSVRNAVADQIANSPETWASDRPVSRKRSA